MKNPFRKLIEAEFGSERYYEFAELTQQENGRELWRLRVTWEMLWSLQQKNKQALLQLAKRMDEALLESERIRRGFWPFWFFGLFAAGLLLYVTEPAAPVLLCLAGMLVLLWYRWLEYRSNLSCSLDIRLFLCCRLALKEALRLAGGSL